MYLKYNLRAAAAATGTLSAAERSYPTSEVRGRSQEDPMPEGRRPRGVTRHPRSGAGAENARLRRRRNGLEELPNSEVRGSSREELPHVQGQGQQPRGATLRTAKRSYPANEVRGGGREELPKPQRLRPGVVAGRTCPTPEARGGGQEDQQNLQGAVAAQAQEGLEELSHAEGQEGLR